MLRNALYYRVKPMLPRGFRMAARRWMARRKLPAASGNWPIAPGSERPPEDWAGWPGGDDFAFVITHDVEGRVGAENVAALAELEVSLGFRSAFNFVPEGEYRVADSLRAWLTDSGFEVGVHDLHHDGFLYASRTSFAERARRINRYLADWGAEGFRSAFMLNRLGWLHDLDARYDMSTFDTDPFEPQPEGRRTIFPFAVPVGTEGDIRRSRLEGKGYLELPYTLPQDSTLFLVLGERTNDIWKRKFEWIARHGGMALLNVHPDYIAFDGAPRDGCSYSVDLYRDFLEFVKSFTGARCWHALPCEVADHCLGSSRSVPAAA